LTTTKLNIKPGDLIEWTYEGGVRRTNKHEKLWSSIEKDWVPIGSKYVHLCIANDSEMYSWLNEKGVFKARTDDAQFRSPEFPYRKVVPRQRT